MNSRDIIRILERDGWRLARVRGSHHQFTHPTKPGQATVPHPKRDIAIGTIVAIEKQAGIKLRGK